MAASPILGHPKNIKLGITGSVDKAFHAMAASPILGHPKNIELGNTGSVDKAFHTKLVRLLRDGLLSRREGVQKLVCRLIADDPGIGDFLALGIEKQRRGGAEQVKPLQQRCVIG